MAKTYLDYYGLTGDAGAQYEPEYLNALNLTYDEELGGGMTGDERLNKLGAIRAGVDVRILTGPIDARFWSIAGPEVQVRIVPDDYVWSERLTEQEWALCILGGMDLSKARELIKKPPKLERGKWYKPYHESLGLLEIWLKKWDGIEQEDNSTTHLEVKDVDWAVGFLARAANQEEFLALDWEWVKGDPANAIGLNISDSSHNYWVPLLSLDVNESHRQDDLRLAHWNYLVSGGSAVYHQARADLGTQSPHDPSELVGKADIHDTQVMAYLCGEPDLHLKVLTRKFLGRDPVEYSGDLHLMPALQQGRYGAAGDTRNTYDLFFVLLEKLGEMGQLNTYFSEDKPVVPVVASMEREGQPISIANTMRLHREFATLETAMRRAVLENYGRDIGDKSDKEIATRRLIMDFGYGDPGTVDQRVISRNQDGIVDLILFYRKHRTRRNNFLGKILKRWSQAGRPDDFRIFTRFNQAGGVEQENHLAPRSGRLSSSDPNFQQQPRDIRKCFVAPEGYNFFSYDYSGLELHLAAGLSGDEVMLAALINGDDLHGMFQQKILELTGVEVERSYAKAGNFEQLYGGGPDTLVGILAKERAFIDLETAKAIVASHAQTFPGYHKWVEKRRRAHKKQGYAETLWGRRRYLPDLYSTDDQLAGNAARAGVNHEVQGPAADILKRQMELVTVEVMGPFHAHLAIQAHDELCGWVPKDVDEEEFDRMMRQTMESVEIPRLKLKVEGGIGDNWDEVH